MTNPNASDWRDIGDTTVDVYRSEFARAKSPMLADADAIYEAARPHSALILAHSWMENQHNTTNILIPKDAHNFLALRPEYPGEKGPFASGVIYTASTGQFLSFDSFVDCVKEWHRRTWQDADDYKGYGPYAKTTTLSSYIGTYAPAGDVHGVTGRDNADINYLGTVQTVLKRFAQQEGTVTPTPTQPPKERPVAITYHKVPQFGYLDRPISKPEGKGWNNLGKRNPRFLVLHRMVGSLWGTDGYFRQSSVNALTDYGLGIAAQDGAGQSGVIIRWNDPEGFRAGWASGPVSAPYGDGLGVVNKYGINAVNRDGVSVEVSGTDQALDEKSWKELVHLCAWHIDDMEIPYTSLPLNPHTGLNVLIWHQEFTIGTGKTCPFPWLMRNTMRLYDDIKAFLKPYQEGGATVPTPEQPKPTPVETGGLKIGDWVVFDGAYNVRRAWNTDEYFDGEKNVVRTTAAGEKAKIIAGPNVNDGYTWWDVEIPGFGTGHVIADGMSKTDAPAPPAPPEKMWKDPAPVTELALADPDTFGDLVLPNGVKFKPVFDEVKATRQGKQRRFAIDGDNVDVIGPDYKPGDQFTALCRFVNDSGTEYYYLSNHARVLFDDFDRVSDTADFTEEAADALTGVLNDLTKN